MSDPLNPEAAKFTNNNFCGNFNTILLQTAATKIFNPTMKIMLECYQIPEVNEHISQTP